MTQDPNGQDYLDLFKPKADDPTGEPPAGETPAAPSPEAFTAAADDLDATRPSQPPDKDAAAGLEGGFEPSPPLRGAPSVNPRTVAMIAGGGCLLLLLSVVVVFAAYQVFFRQGDKDEAQGTPTPTQVADATAPPTAVIAESPLIVPVVSSDDVRVPVALPEQLRVGRTTFAVQAIDTPAGAWPDAPTGDAAAWAYGSVVNYILRLAPTPENNDLLSTLQVDDLLSLRMSSGLTLNFNVDQVTVGAITETALFEQISPRLTLGLLAGDPAQHLVVTAAFSSDEPTAEDLLAGAIVGEVGETVDQGLARVTVMDAYQVDAGEAGLPPGTGYLLIDFAVENVGTQALETQYFQTFVSDASGERYPLTLLAEQFAHHGMPTDPLSPGEIVIGSLGYLVPDRPEGQVNWAFNPLPGSDLWMTVPVSYALPAPPPTAEPPPPVGFAVVNIDPEDIFVDRRNNLLDINLVIDNISEGEVQVTQDDILLSAFPDGELEPTPAPPLPWTIEAGQSRTFQLQFSLPSADSVSLTVLGYIFSIENLSNQ